MITKLSQLLGSHADVLVDVGVELLKQYAFRTRRAGLYAVNHHETALELTNRQGSVAHHHKIQTIRFLQDNIMVYPDTAWGDGDIFVDYQCSPGKLVDMYREGNRYRLMISLRKTMNRNDVEKIDIRRTINGGFTRPEEEFQTEVNHFTDYLKTSITFPKSRLPIDVSLIKRNESRTLKLGKEHHQILASGKHRYCWSTQHPRRFEAYILRWRW